MSILKPLELILIHVTPIFCSHRTSNHFNSCNTNILFTQDFKSDLQTGQDMVNRVASLGDRLCQTTAPRGQDIVRREVQSLREDWGAFSNAVSDVESNLESCISNWLELDDDHGILLTWLTTMESEVKALSEPRANQALKTKQYKEGEVGV